MEYAYQCHNLVRFSSPKTEHKRDEVNSLPQVDAIPTELAKTTVCAIIPWPTRSDSSRITLPQWECVRH